MYYVITKGRKSQIVNNWNNCYDIIKKHNGAKYKEFILLNDAEEYYKSYNCITNGNIIFNFTRIINDDNNKFNKYKFNRLNNKNNNNNDIEKQRTTK